MLDLLPSGRRETHTLLLLHISLTGMAVGLSSVLFRLFVCLCDLWGKGVV